MGWPYLWGGLICEWSDLWVALFLGGSLNYGVVLFVDGLICGDLILWVAVLIVGCSYFWGGPIYAAVLLMGQSYMWGWSYLRAGCISGLVLKSLHSGLRRPPP